jgi:hypothetical protein
MLSDTEAPTSGETFPFESPTPTSYWCSHCSVDMFRLILTVFERYSRKFNLAATDTPLAPFESRPRLPVNSLLTYYLCMESFPCYSRFFTRYLHESYD